ncbi:MAG: hypothetical protein AB7R77_14235, partial [Ilumatobacteraceae bacterium]
QVGSTYPAYRVAVMLAGAAARAGRSHVAGVARPLPVAFHAWRSAGVVHVLLGNLETGEFGDSRLERQVELRLSRRELGPPEGDLVLRRLDGTGPDEVALARIDDVMSRAAVTLAPESAVVYRIVASGSA